MVNRYLQKITSDQNLLICIDKGVWGAQQDKLRRWCPGDEVLRAERTGIEEQKLEYAPVEREEIVVSEEAGEDVHTKIQCLLAKFGHALEMSVWIPKRDRRKECNDTLLKDLSLSELPPLPFGEEVARIVREIDVIWFRGRSPFRLFEVERTTAVYSGLLRMSDLIALVPYLNIGMYICAPPSRKEKVLEEVNRPTFRKLELHRACRFISFERLEHFMQANDAVLDQFKPTVLDGISESCDLAA